MTDDDLEGLVVRERMAAEHHDTVEQLQAENAELEEALTATTSSFREAMRQRRLLLAAVRAIDEARRQPNKVHLLVQGALAALKVRPARPK